MKMNVQTVKRFLAGLATLLNEATARCPRCHLIGWCRSRDQWLPTNRYASIAGRVSVALTFKCVNRISGSLQMPQRVFGILYRSSRILWDPLGFLKMRPSFQGFLTVLDDPVGVLENSTGNLCKFLGSLRLILGSWGDSVGFYPILQDS